MRGAAVRVREASVDARGVLLWFALNARCDYRISQGDIKATGASARVSDVARSLVINGTAAHPAEAVGSGSGGLRAKRKTATLHGFRSDPVCPDMQQRLHINS